MRSANGLVSRSGFASRLLSCRISQDNSTDVRKAALCAGKLQPAKPRCNVAMDQRSLSDLVQPPDAAGGLFSRAIRLAAKGGNAADACLEMDAIRETTPAPTTRLPNHVPAQGAVEHPNQVSGLADFGQKPEQR
jgi:hypothetical protein